MMEESGFESINIIPLVDVMLVLLTIVLTTSTFIATGALPMALPKAANSATETAAKGVTIEINKAGLIYLDAKPTSISALQVVLGQMDRQRPILIRADKAIELQLFVNVMDLLKGLSFKQVSLQTEAAL